MAGGSLQAPAFNDQALAAWRSVVEKWSVNDCGYSRPAVPACSEHSEAWISCFPVPGSLTPIVAARHLQAAPLLSQSAPDSANPDFVLLPKREASAKISERCRRVHLIDSMGAMGAKV
jgi:hypothetical protein